MKTSPSHSKRLYAGHFSTNRKKVKIAWVLPVLKLYSHWPYFFGLAKKYGKETSPAVAFLSQLVRQRAGHFSGTIVLFVNCPGKMLFQLSAAPYVATTKPGG